ncbi:hypothetical protein G6F37_003596 [Rhizopus arrhizus]|nr:hypothetical protein G6F38_005223 [Rhizopus arrhizus]KAG1160866.1 hypothetical protein G6F37_003596 [Rhizopus arrhizus]
MVFDLSLDDEGEGNAQGMCDKDEKVEKFPEIDLNEDMDENRIDVDLEADLERENDKSDEEFEANYDSDSSTEEAENTTGDIPLEWYKDLPHIDYNMDGNKVLKPATVVELDQFLATVEDPDGWKTVRNSDDHTHHLWEALTGRSLSLWRPDGVTHALVWCPNLDVWLFAISVSHSDVPLISPLKLGSPLQTMNIHQLAKAGFAHPAESKQNVSWIKANESDVERCGLRACVNHALVVKQLAWHGKDDSLATVAPDAKHLALFIHSISKHQTQAPFKCLV